MLPEREARMLLEKYLDGRVEIDEIADRLAPLTAGMSLVDFTEGGFSSMAPSARARMAELIARFPQRPAEQPLHVRRLQLASIAVPADPSAPDERVVSVDVFGLDAVREYRASMALRVREAPRVTFESTASWYWDQGTLVIPKFSAQLIQEALSYLNRSTTNDSWPSYVLALVGRVGAGAISEAS